MKRIGIAIVSGVAAGAVGYFVAWLWNGDNFRANGLIAVVVAAAAIYAALPNK